MMLTQIQKALLFIILWAAILLILQRCGPSKVSQLFVGMKCRIRLDEPARRDSTEADVTIVSCDDPPRPK